MTITLPQPTAEMLSPTTRVGKNLHGNWSATSTVDLAPLGAGFEALQLSIRTTKLFSGSTATTASVGKVEGQFVTHRMYQDYSKRLTLVKVRGTEKAISDLHAQALKEDLATVLAEVVAQYAPREV